MRCDTNDKSHYDLRKFSFANRIVNMWNSLPNAVVDFDSVDLFKSRLDNFWMLQDVKYDYTVDLTTLSTLPVPEMDLSLTLKIIEKL